MLQCMNAAHSDPEAVKTQNNFNRIWRQWSLYTLQVSNTNSCTYHSWSVKRHGFCPFSTKCNTFVQIMYWRGRMHVGSITIVGGRPLNITLPRIQSSALAGFAPSSVQMVKTPKPCSAARTYISTALPWSALHRPCFFSSSKFSVVCPDLGKD